MTDTFRSGFLICLFLIIGVFIAGCSDDSSSPAATPVVTTLPSAQFAAGDIIARTSSGGETQLYVIRKFDPVKDEYERQWIHKNADGSWGHYIDNHTEWASRTVVEKVYPVTVAHVSVLAIPIVTPTYATPVPTILSGSAPSVVAISPASGATDAMVTVSIAGTNFVTGAVPKLLQPGSTAIIGTGVSVSATKIDCTFNLRDAETGSYNVIVTNPDGQTASRSSIFTVGDPAPIISGVIPNKLEVDEKSGLSISGENFNEAVKVSLVRGTSEIPCTSPVSSSGARITCDLDLNANRYPQITSGDWDVQVLNIEGTQYGTWTKKFTILNATSDNDS